MKKLVIHAAMASLLCAPAVFAGNHGSGGSCAASSCNCQHDDTDSNHMQQAIEKLDLNFKQKRELRRTRLEFREKQQEIATKMQKNMIALQDYSHGNYNKSAVSKLAKEQGKLVAKRIETNMALRNALYNVLNDAQKKQFNQMLEGK